MSLTALESMFEEVASGIQRANLGIPDEYTTDPQAEILILGVVDPKYIIDINVNEESRVNDMASLQRLFQPFSGSFTFLHDESLFTYRSDYEHWKRH